MSKHLTRLSARAVLALVGTAALILVLHGLSRVGLRGPSGRSRAEIESWFDDPITAVATVLRWMALVMSYYLAAILVAVITTRNQLEESPIRFVIPTHLATAVGLLIGIGAVAVPLTGHMARTVDPLESAASEELHLTKLDGSLTLDQLHPEITTERPHTPVPETPHQNADTRTSRRDVDHSWTVAQGDSFWRIADEHLQDSWEREVTESEVATYWKQLIEANSERLVDPGNPDLLFPGQVLTLPEVPPLQR